MKSINKVLDVLEVFLSMEGNEIRLSDLARLSGLNKSTVNRIVSVLLDRGYLSQRERWGKYSIGVKFLVFGEMLKRRLKVRDIALPYMVELSHLTKESIILATWNGKEAFFREVIESSNPLKMIPEEGDPIPLYCTGIGKIILADMTEQELNQYFGNTKLTIQTPNTITDINLIKKQLKIIAEENVSYDEDEFFLGSSNLSSGIRDITGRIVACVGVLGPSSRLTQAKMIEIAPDIKRCALEISRALGYNENISNTAAQVVNQPKRKSRQLPTVNMRDS